MIAYTLSYDVSSRISNYVSNDKYHQMVGNDGGRLVTKSDLEYKSKSAIFALSDL